MHTPLITMLVVGLGLAFILGAVANRLKLSPLVGYLVAGIVIGPFTPGYVADQAMARQLAEVGVILLMFGSGLHFSLADLLSVRKIAIPGAVGQMALVTLLGLGVGMRSAGRSAPESSSALRCRSPARWWCCARCRKGINSNRSRVASPSAGWSSRISR